jgi:hypothetical protein
MKAILSTIFCVSLMGCASTSNRYPAAEDQPKFFEQEGIRDSSVPSPKQLFLFGKFATKAPHRGIREENHYGHELDLSERRPVVNLNGSVFAEQYAKPGYDLFANFSHNGNFYIVNVPQNSVKNYYFQISYFHYGKGIAEKIAPAAHSLLRFEMNQPIEIVAEMPTLKAWQHLSKLSPAQIQQNLAPPFSGKEYLILNAAISAEAQWTKKDPKKAYDLRRGMHSAFIQIVRFVSMESRFNEFYKTGNPAEQYLMEGPAADGSQVLAKGLEISESDALKKIYDTTQLNCTTRAFDIVEEALNVKDQRIGFIRSHASKALPFLAKDKVAEFNGKDLVNLPLVDDKTLAEESFNAWERIVKPRGELCPSDLPYREKNCPNLSRAVETLKEAGKSLN